MITNNLQRHPFLRLLMPLVGGIVYGDKYPYILSVGWWIAVILLLIGTYILGRKYYVLCKLYGAVVFLACFVLGWTLVSVQLKQAEYIFPNTEKPSTYRITLTTKPEIKKNSILFRVALRNAGRHGILPRGWRPAGGPGSLGRCARSGCARKGRCSGAYGHSTAVCGRDGPR